jgi:hypothetical protein
MVRSFSQTRRWNVVPRISSGRSSPSEGIVHEADHPRQVIADHDLVCDEFGLGKPGGKVRRQLLVSVSYQNGTDARGAPRDQHAAQGAFASRIGDDFDDIVGMS